MKNSYRETIEAGYKNLPKLIIAFIILMAILGAVNAIFNFLYSLTPCVNK